MYIQSIDFQYQLEDGSGWQIKDCTFDSINLISGKNASGKTRLLLVIRSLVILLSSNKISEENDPNLYWSISLKNNTENLIYEVSCKRNHVLREKLTINENVYLDRNSEGKGNIVFSAFEKQQLIEFEVENNKLVATSKRDRKQHPFLEGLLQWSEQAFFYDFGGLLGKDTLFRIKEIDRITRNSDIFQELSQDDRGVIPKFAIGLKEFKNEFKQSIIESFNCIGYAIDDIYLAPYPIQHTDTNSIPKMLYISEHQASKRISQNEISQGMFRALSLIIQLTYLEFNLKDHATILIDDIGEGLDFERSTKLIKFLIDKAESLKEKIQLIMTTNDRFVMNNVPLKYWTVIEQSEGQIQLYSERTHPELFEEFGYIGLNNFDFFSGQFYKAKASEVVS